MIDIQSYVPKDADLEWLEIMLRPGVLISKSINILTRLVDQGVDGRGVGRALFERFITLGWLTPYKNSPPLGDLQIAYYQPTDAARAALEKYQREISDGTPDRIAIVPPPIASPETATLKALVNPDQPLVRVCGGCRQPFVAGSEIRCAYCGMTAGIRVPLLMLSNYLFASKEQLARENSLLEGALDQGRISLLEYGLRRHCLNKTEDYLLAMERVRKMRQDVDDKIRKAEAELAQKRIDEAA